MAGSCHGRAGLRQFARSLGSPTLLAISCGRGEKAGQRDGSRWSERGWKAVNQSKKPVLDVNASNVSTVMTCRTRHRENCRR